MLVARLKVEESNGRKTLGGVCTAPEPVKAGELLILKREGDQYVLSTIDGFPKCTDKQAVFSFIEAPEDENSPAGTERG